MSPQTTTTLSWVDDDVAGELRLDIVESAGAAPMRSVVVPVAIDHDLTVLDEAGQTSDPADDLLRLEGWLRLRAARLADYATLLEQEARTASAEYLDHTDRWRWPWSRRRERRHLGRQLSAASAGITAGRSAIVQAALRVLALRRFVIALELPDGLLAEASSGWLRDPAQPAFVSRYHSEAIFLRADPRRAGTLRHGAVRVGGRVYGTRWRRDGDDDDPHAPGPAVGGPWQLGYIPATGEVYASRRCDYHTPQVWLLGHGFTEPDHAHRLLTGLMRGHMLAPNSLLHAAAVVHDAAEHAVRPGAAGEDRP